MIRVRRIVVNSWLAQALAGQPPARDDKIATQPAGGDGAPGEFDH